MSKKKKFKKYHKVDLLHQVLAQPHESYGHEAVVARIPARATSTSEIPAHVSSSQHHGVILPSAALGGGSLVPPTAIVLADVRRIGLITAVIALLYVTAAIAQRKTALFEKTADFLFRALNIS